jgi:hypothetical protein
MYRAQKSFDRTWEAGISFKPSNDAQPEIVVRDTPPTIRLFRTRSFGFKVFALLIAPPAYGVISGLALGASAAAYWVLIAIGVLGAISSGYEHDRPLEAIGRGSLGAVLFTVGLLAIFRITGAKPHVMLPAPHLFLPLNCIAGAIISAPSAWLRRRAELQAAKDCAVIESPVDAELGPLAGL